MSTSPTQALKTALHMHVPKKRTTLWSYFLQGLLAVTPLAVTYFILKLLFGFVHGIVDNTVIFLPPDLRAIVYIRVGTELATFLLLCISLIVLGMLVKTVMGKFLFRRVDDLLSGLPGLNTIYKATKQVIELLTMEKEQLLMTPVLVEWPSPGKMSLAFNTGPLDERIVPAGLPQHFTVFIPHTPNPTSGYLAVLPGDKITKLDISVEEAVRMVLTGGMVKPGAARSRG
jgi:uncharacterized membrane protein